MVRFVFAALLALPAVAYAATDAEKYTEGCMANIQEKQKWPAERARKSCECTGAIVMTRMTPEALGVRDVNNMTAAERDVFQRRMAAAVRDMKATCDVPQD